MKNLQFFLLLFIFSVQNSICQIPLNDSRIGIEPNEKFGYCVDMDGSYTVVSAPFATKNGDTIGRVQVYEYPGISLREAGDIVWGKTNNELFGAALDIHGTQFIVGIPNYDNGRGAVRIYSLNSAQGNWIQKGDDIIGDIPGGRFGTSVSLKPKGDTLVVGAPNSNNNQGQSQVFYWDNGWKQLGNTILGQNEGDESGKKIIYSKKNNFVLIGEPAMASNGDGMGQVRIFKLNNGNWELVDKALEAEEANSGFGTSIDASYGLGRIVIGEPFLENDKGCIKTYSLKNDQILSDLVEPHFGEKEGEYFGSEIQISWDSYYLSVSSPRFNDSTGRVKYLYSVNYPSWIYNGFTYYESSIPTDGFASDFAMDSGGDYLVIGAPSNDSLAKNSGWVGQYLGKLVTVDEPIEPQTTITFPNPAFDDLNFREQINGYFNILNNKGELIKKGDINGSSINIENLSSGIYYYQIKTTKGPISGKFIKVNK
jgi:hypothetical protein